jgi:hypothetical protein
LDDKREAKANERRYQSLREVSTPWSVMVMKSGREEEEVLSLTREAGGKRQLIHFLCTFFSPFFDSFFSVEGKGVFVGG